MRENTWPCFGLLPHLSFFVLYSEDGFANWWRMRWESDRVVFVVAGGRDWEGGFIVGRPFQKFIEIPLLVVVELEGETEGLMGELDELVRDELVVVVVLGQKRSPHIFCQFYRVLNVVLRVRTHVNLVVVL